MAPPSGPGAATTTGTAREPETFTGAVDDFYRVPDPLPHGEPGELIRTQAVKHENNATTVRIMYHSRDAQDRDRAVTGVITYPDAAAPADGWPVMAWAHGTTGMSTTCAPSRRGGTAPWFGLDSVRVASDFIGLGPIGERHAYLSGLSEGHSVIDSVRAARRYTAAHAGTTWVAAGVSQGGHAALFTNELGQAYAPELDLRGTVTIAPASVLDKTFGPDDQLVPRMVGVMALYGIATDHPDIHPDDYVSDAVKAQESSIDTGCLTDVVKAMAPIPAETFYKKNPIETDPARAAMIANDPGHVKVAAPLLLVYGTADNFVVPARVLYLYDQLCSIGQVTEIVKIDGAGHDNVSTMAGAQINAWLAERLGAKPAPSSCPDQPG